jgi:protein involved in polysaccharide export with SLBB domain
MTVRALLLSCVAVVLVSPVTSGQSQVSSSRYTIQVSDVVALSYRYSPEYDFTGPVQPDGYITVPLLGAIQIGGLTVEAARDEVTQRARMRLRDPEISFVLKEFQKPLFTVGGEVEKPGQFQLHGRVGVLEAVAMAGGFKRSAKHSKVVLLRRFDNDRHAHRRQTHGARSGPRARYRARARRPPGGAAEQHQQDRAVHPVCQPGLAEPVGLAIVPRR